MSANSCEVIERNNVSSCDTNNKPVFTINNNPSAVSELSASVTSSPHRTVDSLNVNNVNVHKRLDQSVGSKSPKLNLHQLVGMKKSSKGASGVAVSNKASSQKHQEPTDSEDSLEGDDETGDDSERRSIDSQSVESHSLTGGGQETRLPQPSSAVQLRTLGSGNKSVVAISQGRGIQGRTSRRRPVSEEWELLEGLRSGQMVDNMSAPPKFGGYIMKSRKWPMKGWHKRYFFLDNGILTYAKTSVDLEKGKFHGTVDTGLSVIACKKKGRRIDVDADDLIYHLKTKSSQQFEEWTSQLRQHRLYRQYELSYGTKDAPKLIDVTTPVDDFPRSATPITPDSPCPFDRQAAGSFKGRSLDRSQNKVAAWLIDSHGAQAWNKELTSIQSKIFELGTTLERLKDLSRTTSVGGSCSNFADNSVPSADAVAMSPTSKSSKGTKKYGLGKSASKTKERKSKDRLSAGNGLPAIHLSSSNPNLSVEMTDSAGSLSLPLENFTYGDRLHEQFFAQAKGVHETLKICSRMITTECERLKRALEQDSGLSPIPSSNNYVQSLKQSLSEALKQNAEYRSRLARIHAESSIADLKPVVSPLLLPGRTLVSSGPPSVKEHPRLAASESLGSQTEFYDAEENLNTSSEESEEEEIEDEDISDTENTAVPPSEEDGQEQITHFHIRRRSKLPVPRGDSDVSVWSLLCKNIGKDLSKICMPVSLNEPLNALQRLCEELEYSELLDRVADLEDPCERMVWIAAFAVSAYASTYTRGGQKPFNPLLGETYECIREDKGWKFVAEQVSHHPPVSACHCESKNFTFWQDVQVKTKFWGKSMEVQPIGLVHLKLLKQHEHYTWNKATSCVHNLLGGERWIDHYGEVTIKNHTNNIVCKLTFVKSSYWSAKKHEIYGTVQGADGKTVHQLYGKWNEGLYYGGPQTAKCIWRPGSMPMDSEMYYGFTRFAIELNEIDEDQAQLYPCTDTRFRPDQRLLEEGKLAEAEAEKQRLEQMQREKRKARDDSSYNPMWFTLTKESDGKESYIYTGRYWETRRDPGFKNIELPQLW